MKQEKFKVVDFIRMFVKSLSFNLDSFPKKEYELKERVKKNAYDVLELAYEANTTEVMELKVNLINKILAKLRVIDFLLDMAVEMDLLPRKKYIKMANSLADIEKYARGWLLNVKRGFENFRESDLREQIKEQTNTIVIEKEMKDKKLKSEKGPEMILLSEKSKKELNQV